VKVRHWVRAYMLRILQVVMRDDCSVTGLGTWTYVPTEIHRLRMRAWSMSTPSPTLIIKVGDRCQHNKRYKTQILGPSESIHNQVEALLTSAILTPPPLAQDPPAPHPTQPNTTWERTSVCSFSPPDAPCAPQTWHQTSRSAVATCPLSWIRRRWEEGKGAF
jgi:hypothetical protein